MTLKKILPLVAVFAVILPAGTALAAPKSKFRFSQATYVASEGQGSIDVTVTRIPRHGHSKTNQTSSVNFAVTGGSATQGTDYTLTPAPSKLTFAPNELTKTITVGIIQDTEIEGVESINLKLSAASSNSLITNPRTAQVLIADDDGPTQVELVPSSQNVSEGAGVASFFAVRSGDLTGPATTATAATADGSAVAPGDYTAIAPSTVTFAAGTLTTAPEFSKQIDVPIVDDSVVENPEDFSLTLSNLSADAVFPNSAASVTASTTIVDNDSPPVFALDASSYQVNEDGSVDVTVNRLGNALAPTPVGPNDIFTVDWVTSDGTATNPADYVPAADNQLEFDSTDDAETVTIANDPTTQIQLIDDALAEGDENFGLALANPSGSATLGSPASANVTIHDNDVAAPAGDDTGGSTGNGGSTDNGGAGAGGDQGSQIVLGARQSACGLVVKASKKQKLLKKKVLLLKLRSSQRCKVSLNATLKQLRVRSKHQAQIVRALRLKSKKTSLTLQPGKAVTVKVKFTKRTLKAIKKALQARNKKLVATVVVTEQDSSSVSKRRTMKITVRR